MIDDILVIAGLVLSLIAAAWVDIRLVVLVIGLTLMVVGFVRAG